MGIVEIHYTRPPGRVTQFRQELVHTDATCSVTLLEDSGLQKPVMARERVVLECGAPIVWFTFPGAWHDIGRFHMLDGRFTGFYANILTPVEFRTPLQWHTTDLFLDVWLDEHGVTLLDEDELERAVAEGALSGELAARARTEADTLVRRAAAATWPPAVCREITLERARATLRGTPGGRTV